MTGLLGGLNGPLSRRELRSLPSQCVLLMEKKKKVEGEKKRAGLLSIGGGMWGKAMKRKESYMLNFLH